MEPNVVPKFAYTVVEAARATSISRSTLYEEVRDGRLRLIKVGRRSLILDEDLRAWLGSLAPRTP